MLILRLFRVLLQVYELFCVAYVGCLWRVRQPTGPPASKSEFALFQTSSLYALPRSISLTHLTNVGKFFQSGLNQRTVSKFRNLEYENFRIMFYTSFIKRNKTLQWNVSQSVLFVYDGKEWMYHKVQSWRFACKTYRFSDVLVSVTIVVSKLFSWRPLSPLIELSIRLHFYCPA